MCLRASVTLLTGFVPYFYKKVAPWVRAGFAITPNAVERAMQPRYFLAAGVMENGRDSGAVPHADGFGPMPN